MPIPVHDDRILQYIKPFQGRCPGQNCTAYIMNKRAYEVSDTYWCPYCMVDRRQFTLVDLAQFGPEKLEHIKNVVREHLREHRGYYVNIRY
jgi:hypothetical protein